MPYIIEHEKSPDQRKMLIYKNRFSTKIRGNIDGHTLKEARKMAVLDSYVIIHMI